MAIIEFSTTEKELLTHKLQDYFQQELSQPLEQFDAEFLLDFFSEQLGSYFYNKGLNDAQQVIDSNLDSLKDAIYAIEKPTEFIK